MKKSKLTGFLLVSPSSFLIFMILIFPIFYTVYTSMFRSDNLVFRDFIGFQNYIDLWSSKTAVNSLFRGLAVTFIALVVAMLFGIIASLWISSKTGEYAYFLQLLCLIPWFTSLTVTALTWRWLIESDYGLLNFVLKSLGLQPMKILETPTLAFFMLCFIIAWRTIGYIMILVLSGLKALPEDMLEASTVDGADYFQTLFYIKLPNIKSQIILAFILITLSNLNNSTIPLTFNGGGPAEATNTIALHLYQLGFIQYTYGRASALSVVILILNIVFIAFYMRSMRYEKT